MSYGLLADVSHLWFDKYSLQDAEQLYFNPAACEHVDTDVTDSHSKKASSSVGSSANQKSTSKSNAGDQRDSKELTQTKSSSKADRKAACDESGLKKKQKDSGQLPNRDEAGSLFGGVSLSAEIGKLRGQIQAVLQNSVPVPQQAPVVKGDEAAELRSLVMDMRKHMEFLEKRVAQLESANKPREAVQQTSKEASGAVAVKKGQKPALIAKSQVILDIKPWDDETDMVEMERRVRTIEMDGLLWGVSKLVPLAYGIKKLQICSVVEDEKVSIDDLQEKITEENEDLVQSVDVASFQKI